MSSIAQYIPYPLPDPSANFADCGELPDLGILVHAAFDIAAAALVVVPLVCEAVEHLYYGGTISEAFSNLHAPTLFRALVELKQAHPNWDPSFFYTTRAEGLEIYYCDLLDGDRFHFDWKRLRFYRTSSFVRSPEFATFMHDVFMERDALRFVLSLCEKIVARANYYQRRPPRSVGLTGISAHEYLQSLEALNAKFGVNILSRKVGFESSQIVDWVREFSSAPDYGLERPFETVPSGTSGNKYPWESFSYR